MRRSKVRLCVEVGSKEGSCVECCLCRTRCRDAFVFTGYVFCYRMKFAACMFGRPGKGVWFAGEFNGNRDKIEYPFIDMRGLVKGEGR